MIFYDLEDYNIFLNVLKDGLRIVFHYAIVWKSIQCWGLTIFFQFVSNIIHKWNKICFIWWHKFLVWSIKKFCGSDVRILNFFIKQML